MPYADKQAQREYQRQWIARRRKTWFSDKKCVQCGSTHEMELDHVDPTEKVSHRIWSWKMTRFQAEIVKCQVLCSECHQKKTTDSATLPLVHGTYHGYRQKCHCTKCRAANAECKRLNNWDPHVVRFSGV